jgi:hypothetical protein
VGWMSKGIACGKGFLGDRQSGSVFSHHRAFPNMPAKRPPYTDPGTRAHVPLTTSFVVVHRLCRRLDGTMELRVKTTAEFLRHWRRE